MCAQPPGGRAIDPQDYPAEKSVYAFRNVTALQQQADQAGSRDWALRGGHPRWPLAVDAHAPGIWLLSLVKRYGPTRVTEVCTAALAADMLDVRRLQRMLVLGLATPPAPPPARTLPRACARYLRRAHQYALPLRPPADREESE